MIQIAHLKNRSLLRLSGPDTMSFLQNLVTCDIENLLDGEAGFGALLTPQGKVLFDFFALRDRDAIIFDTSSEQRDELLKRLTFYKLRADVKIEKSEQSVFGVWSDTNDDGYEDPRNLNMGRRVIADELTTNALQQDWDAHRILIGIPESGTDFDRGAVFPHDVLMDQFALRDRQTGVNFTKGCYVGQEVVSRMQHRGTARNRIVKVESSGSDLPPMGTEIIAGDKTIGKMGGSIGSSGLAMVRIDRAASAVTGQIVITAADQMIALQKPDFADYSWP